LYLTGPSYAAVGEDLDPRVLLMQNADRSGRCRTGGGAQDGDACCGTSFQAVSGSIESRGTRSLCFGAQSISALTSGAPSQNTAQKVAPPPLTIASGGGGGSSSRVSNTVVSSFFSSGPSEPLGQAFFGGSGGSGGSNVGAPGPEAGAGLPFLFLAGGYALMRRRRARSGTAGQSST
jgi:hypothetical protein